MKGGHRNKNVQLAPTKGTAQNMGRVLATAAWVQEAAAARTTLLWSNRNGNTRPYLQGGAWQASGTPGGGYHAVRVELLLAQQGGQLLHLLLLQGCCMATTESELDHACS
jgi:hypothetical protein